MVRDITVGADDSDHARYIIDRGGVIASLVALIYSRAVGRL